MVDSGGNFMKDDIIVVGSGFAGSIIARLFAEEGKKVRLIERRNHIAGNMYDFVSEDGIRIQKYGPHTFHTNMEHVYNYVNQFCDLEKYHLKCEAVIKGNSTPSPFNFKTIDQYYSAEEAEKLKRKLVAKYGNESATVLEMLNSHDEDIKGYAQFLFENDYSKYTAKQWGVKPEEIDPSVLKRVPIVFNYKDTYFYDKYEALPKNGFTNLFQNILSHPLITVELNKDAIDDMSFEEKEQKVYFEGNDSLIIFTGAIDELFDYKFGQLPYRSLYFEYEKMDVKSYQSVAIIAHPEEVPYTRITEYTKLPFQDVGNKTVIAKEYSILYNKQNEKGNEQYYPVLTDESNRLYIKYKDYADKFNNLVLCGRLAEFKYYNMDAVIDRTLSVFREIKSKYL